MPARPLDDVLMETQDLALRAVTPHADAVDREGAWPEQAMREMQKAGLMGLVVPEDKGGLGHGLYGLLRACETLGLHCASTAMCFGMHGVASAVLAAKATPEQVERSLEPIVSGRHVTSLALSEPGTGAHFYIPEARIRRAPEGYVMEGVKSFVTSGGHADSYVVSGANEDAPTPGVFSLMHAPAEAPGLRWQEAWRGSGMRGNSSRNLVLDRVRLPPRALLGREGDQAWYVFNVVAPFFLTAMAGTYLGVSQAALDEARAHLGARRHAHTGQHLGQAGVLQHRLGSLWAQVERARRLCYYAAEQGDTNGPDAMPGLLSAKAEAADTAVAVTNECMTLLGGLGYAQGSRADRHLRDARAAPVMAPTTDMLRTWTGRWLLGEPLLAA